MKSRDFFVEIPDQFLQRSFGMDQVLDKLNAQMHYHARSKPDGFPPYDVVVLEDNKWEVRMAVAGYKKSELTVTEHDGLLIVEGKPEKTEMKTNYQHRGLGARSFKRTFTLGDHASVAGSWCVDGMLNIAIEQEIPAELQPKNINIE